MQLSQGAIRSGNEIMSSELTIYMHGGINKCPRIKLTMHFEGQRCIQCSVCPLVVQTLYTSTLCFITSRTRLARWESRRLGSDYTTEN